MLCALSGNPLHIALVCSVKNCAHAERGMFFAIVSINKIPVCMRSLENSLWAVVAKQGIMANVTFFQHI